MSIFKRGTAPTHAVVIPAEQEAKQKADEVAAAEAKRTEEAKSVAAKEETEAALTFPLTGAQLAAETLKLVTQTAEKIGSPLTEEQSAGLFTFFASAEAPPGGVTEEQVFVSLVVLVVFGWSLLCFRVALLVLVCALLVDSTLTSLCFLFLFLFAPVSSKGRRPI